MHVVAERSGNGHAREGELLAFLATPHAKNTAMSD